MRALPEAKLFSTHLIDDMHAAFEVVCSRLGLAPTSDKATELVHQDRRTSEGRAQRRRT